MTKTMFKLKYKLSLPCPACYFSKPKPKQSKADTSLLCNNGSISFFEAEEKRGCDWRLLPTISIKNKKLNHSRSSFRATFFFFISHGINIFILVELTFYKHLGPIKSESMISFDISLFKFIQGSRSRRQSH